MVAEALQFIIDTEGTGHWDVTSEVRRFQFGTRSPGGFWETRVTLDTAPRNIWQYYHAWPGGTLTRRSLGALIWEGDLAGFRTLDPLTVIARGEVLRLRLPELWRIFADAEYRNWAPELGEERAFAVDNNNRVYVAANRGVIYEAGDEGRVAYPEAGVVLGAGITRFEATAEIDVDYGDWVAELRDGAGTVLWSTTSSTETEIDVAVNSAEELLFALRATAEVNLGDVDWEAGDVTEPSARLTQVVVRTLNPTTSDAIIEALLDLKEIDSFDVKATGLELDRAAWQGVRPLVALEDVVSLGDGAEPWLFTVYEHGAVFRAWSDDPDWILLPEDLARGWDLQQDRDDVRNAVRAKLPDGTITAWQTDADSIADYGRHEETLDILQTSQAEAVRYARVYLEERKEPVGTIEADAGEWIHKPDLTSWPAYFVRAGDVIAVRDVIPGEDVLIRVAETEFDGRRLRITPVGADNRLETLLASLDREARSV